MTLPLNPDDLAFVLHDWLGVEELTEHPRYSEHSRDTFDAVLRLSQDIAMRCFAPHYKLLDQVEPRKTEAGTVELVPEVADALKEFLKSGLLSARFGEELGGAQLPHTVTYASMMWFQAANIALSAYPFLTIGNANLLAAHGTREQIDTWVRPMLEGRYFGTMCLSEPQAGSSLADITTRAVAAADGSYRITGTKMWISGGDHELSENIVHLVLARTPDAPAGVKGISLFIVPKFLESGERNDVALVGLNHKMGYRGTTNTLLNFGDGTYAPDAVPGAVGYLVGQQFHGLRYMFHMMNEARLGVGFGAAALGCAGYQRSVEYARVRTQGRSLTDPDPAGRPVAIIEHPDVRRMLLAQKSYVEGSLGLLLYCAHLLDKQTIAANEGEAHDLGLLLDLLTPIAKSWPSQWCLEANNLAIQVHGGYGYTREYDVEQLYRDNRLNPIHEGSHGIQALDLLGRKVIAEGGRSLQLLDERVQKTISTALQSSGDVAVHGEALATAWSRALEVTASVWASGDPARVLANATPYMEAFGHVVLAWVWLEQQIAASGNSKTHLGKHAAARYFYTFELPKVHPMLDLVEKLDTTLLETSADLF